MLNRTFSFHAGNVALHKPKTSVTFDRGSPDIFKEQDIRGLAGCGFCRRLLFLCYSTLSPFNENRGHLKPPCAADTHTCWKLPAKSGGAAFEGVGRILLLAAQLGDRGEFGAVPVVPDVQGHLQTRKWTHQSRIVLTLNWIMKTSSGIMHVLLRCCCCRLDTTAARS